MPETAAQDNASPRIVRAAMIVIGNEILAGRTQDTSFGHLARALNAIGVRMAHARIVPDEADEIVAALNDLSGAYDYVFTCGGIGPTHDDITAECVARAFGVALIEHPEAVRRLEAYYERIDKPFNAARRRMTRTPDGADLIDNPVSAAPGFRIGNVFVMAGVPQVFRAMTDAVIPMLEGGAVRHARTLISDQPEGHMADGLGRVQDAYPDLEIGVYPSYGKTGFAASIVIRGYDEAAIDRAARDVTALIEGMGGRASPG